MIATYVQFKFSDELTSDKARRLFVEATPRFTQMGGLIRKYFLLSIDGRSGGSVYLWTTQDAAQAFHTEEWMEFMQRKYGSRPTVSYYECPVVVDNAIGEVITDLPEPDHE